MEDGDGVPGESAAELVRERDLHAELAAAERARDELADTTRELAAKVVTLSSMVVRCAREVREPTFRANALEDLGALVPGALDELRAEERPEALRRRTGTSPTAPKAVPAALAVAVAPTEHPTRRVPRRTGQRPSTRCPACGETPPHHVIHCPAVKS